MLMTIFKIYLTTVAIALVAQAMTTARAQIIGIPMAEMELLMTIGCAIIPIANLIVAYDNFTMLFNKKAKFIVRFMFVKGRLDELRVVDEDGKEVDVDIEKFMKGE